MFFILSKILFFLVMPITLVFICLLFAIITKNKKRSRRALICGVVLLYVFSNNFLVNGAFKSWEVEVVPFHKIEKTYDLGIILTGVANTYKEPKDRVYLGIGADRVVHPIYLYKKKIIKKILITGGSGAIFPNETREAEELKKILLLANIPEEDILIEKHSRNTHENAAFSAKVIKENFNDSSQYLLITSAFHMRRALGCFDNAGISCDPFPVDFRADTRNTFDTFFIPREHALQKSYVLIHEMIGYIIYALVGYI